ncbi:DUF1601 domain-containing protein [Pandoraea pulmonicola]|uniref:Protein of uncharacterized function (DUF1601) n=1 Tax=Pandoraea pulmonicola TaxID=93221 RepID=A0AAJ5D2U2_PANPU|nr:DUF1601 domain-containing protein [Pandoraea pulmonicola]APD13521.1 hypothetical protein RO07_22730 [Pandoraea pulmonicola]SUA93218.1 Protein of uncharacterised function (DUF1601) [Pandoraea pulmonicola]
MDDHLKRLAEQSQILSAEVLSAYISDVAQCLQNEAWFGQGQDRKMAHVANKLSKFARVADCATGLAAIAGRIDMRNLQAHEIAMYLNAFCKCPRNPMCRLAVLDLARHIVKAGNALVGKFDAQAIASALNALCKWPSEADARRGALCLARHIVRSGNALVGKFVQNTANTLNALSKWPEEADARRGALCLARHIVRSGNALVGKFSAQNIANTLNALSKWPDQADARHTALQLARHIDKVGNALMDKFDAQDIACTLNALSKWSDQADARHTALRLARHIDKVGNALVGKFDAQTIAITLNALCKWPDDAEARRATRCMARRIIALNDTALNRFNAQSIANTLNALSKWPDDADARRATRRMARCTIELNDTAQNRFNAQSIANTLNALCKWPDDTVARPAMRRMAQCIVELNDAALNRFNAQEIANTLNALCKWPDDADARHAILRLAQRIVRLSDALVGKFNHQGIANTLNALSKWPEETGVRHATLRLARHIDKMDNALVDAFNAQSIANTLNALGKWPDETGARHATLRLARHIDKVGNALMDTFNAREFSCALNALGKWPGDADMQRAALRMARHIVKVGSALVGRFNAQDITNTLSALSKWPDQVAAQDAALALARHIVKGGNALVDKFNAHAITNTLNALGRFFGVEACEDAGWTFAEYLHGQAETWPSYDLRQMAQIANAVARLALRCADQDPPATLTELLQRMGDHMHAHDTIIDAEMLEIATTIKAIAALQLHKTLATLAPSTLARLRCLLPTGLPGDNLETLGNLCIGLLPLLRNKRLSRYRTETLHSLMALHPHVARKATCFLNEPREGMLAVRPTAPSETFDTRCPALTFYQILKTYNVVASMAQESQADQQRGLLVRNWVDAMLTQTRETLQRDLSDMSWNLIAQIEASDDVDDAMDRFMHREHERIAQTCPPTRFDPALVHQAMRGEFREVAPTVGNSRHVLVDMMGRELPREQREAENYSLYARITRLPLVEVKLPGTLSRFMLARTFRYDDQLWRFDMFGGSRLTKGRHQPVEAILAGTSRGHDTLPAVPYADSAPGSALMNLVRKLAPLKEDWARMQRALLETVPHTHVGEGTLTIGWFDDVPGASHPFKPQIDGTPLALCPNDGCGFIKASVAQRIPALRERMQAWEAAPAQQRRDMSRVAPGTMAPQALQHFARDRAALDEARELMRAKLRTIDAVRIPQLQLHDLLVRGPYESMRIRAVPSADDQFHLPTQLCAGLAPGRTAPVLIGKPPYDKENLLPVAASTLATEASGDLTARFLAGHFAIQYSYTGFDETSDTSDTGSMLHGKGMLIVVPDEHWPRHYHALDMACSRQDMKMHSAWTTGRKRHEIPAQMQSTGSLRVKDILLPGQCGAMPIDELRKRDMDTDGDDAFLYLDCPALARAIDGAMQARAAQRGPMPSFKPPKTAQVAIDSNGIYRAGRAREIIDALHGHRLMGRASSAAARYLAQPNEIREQIAKAFKARLQTSGIPAEIGALLDREDWDLGTRNFLTMAIKAGTDALKSDTDTTLFNRWMRSFERAEASCKADPRRVRTVPYTKTTARALRDGSFDPEKTLGELRKNPTMAAGVMEIGIDALRPVLPQQ